VQLPPPVLLLLLLWQVILWVTGMGVLVILAVIIIFAVSCTC
jgi:hypothetical protein